MKAHTLAKAHVRAFRADVSRRDFPILGTSRRGHPLVYLDNAATTQKPRAVLDRLTRYYSEENANVHRTAYDLGGRASSAYEAARESVRRFLNAAEPNEIVFVRGATEAVNLVAETWGRAHVHAGDEVLVSAMEHHSNLLPWQRLCASTGAHLRVIPLDAGGNLRLDLYESLLGPRTRLVALTHVSNTLGTVNPVREMIRLAHASSVPVLVDAAQAVGHLPLDVQALACDFLAFSGHKVYGPTGIGVLYGRRAHLDTMAPWQTGGGMVETVGMEQAEYAPPPHRFEAGTPNIAGAVALASALDYVTARGVGAIAAHEHALIEHAVGSLAQVPGVRLIGAPHERASIASFVLDGVHAHDVATVLDARGIAVRAGHHCCQPLMAWLGVPATVRLSCALYNTHDDIEALVGSVYEARRLLG